MPWFKVDDHFHSHPKVKKCGLEVVGLWTVSGSYCMAHLTDGFVEELFVRGWRRGLKMAATLVEAGLWYEVTRDGEKGWQFHDWDKYQPTKKQVEAEREKARSRKAQQRLSQGESRRDSRGESQGESRGTPGTEPDPPARPSHPLVDLSGEVTQVGPTDPPPKFCLDHMPDGTDRACRGCGRAREAHEAWEQQTERDELDTKRRQRQARLDAIANCPVCDENGNRELDDDTLTRCDRHA
jgi:hypothetical protein